MTKSHLITAATALSLGYAGSFADDGLLAQTSVPQTTSVSVSRTFAPGTGGYDVLDTLRGQAASALCAEAEQKKGFDSGDCTKPNNNSMSLHFDVPMDDGQLGHRASALFKWEGTLTLGAPQ